MRCSLLALSFAAMAAVLTGCGSSAQGGGGAQNGPVTTGEAAPPIRLAKANTARATVQVSASRYGKILVDGTGRTLYLFTHDITRSSRCYGACAVAWPPYTTVARPTTRRGATAGLVGVAPRRSGPQQVTYRGHPLYYYHGETKAGQILCQNVPEFGGTWLVVQPSGDPVR